MESLDRINDELRNLLLQHFQVVATHSQRQDQWYKRSYQSFVSEHGDHKPLIVVPRDSLEEWVPHVRRFAALLVNELEIAGKEPRAKEQPSETKLFSNRVLDESHVRPLCRAICGQKPMTPDMMQMAWWTSSTRSSNKHSKYGLLEGVQALITCGEVEPLLRLAVLPEIRQGKANFGSLWCLSLKGEWDTILPDIITIFLFLELLYAFPKEFVPKYWVPVAFWIEDCPFRRYITALGGNIPHYPDAVLKQMKHCTEAMVAAQAWCTKGGFVPIDWEGIFMDRFLYILGFEAWNRTREGQGYLGCDLNVTKTAKSLSRVGNQDDEDEESSAQKGQNPKVRSSGKPIDPLKLREPKQEVVPVLDEEERQKQEELTVLESYEQDYGRKRSTKYLTKHQD
ncbi:uncharacterized protein FTOL_10927 [Fusarium torulosum]|uniref:Uncharacterized protein n=1 Tax=Fusarium torulosum TaxID=33205 RepID=A0AAE8MI79_9HYPO|nr:uncharacterized protein FTOL_10927 [Fusarium torulosum]